MVINSLIFINLERPSNSFFLNPLKMKRYILLQFLFLSVAAFSQQKIHYTAVKCFGQESVITIDSIEHFVPPVRYSIDDSPFQSNNTFKGYDVGEHKIRIVDAKSTFFESIIEVKESSLVHIDYKSQYVDCQGQGKILINELSGGTTPFKIHLNDEEIPLSNELTITKSTNTIRVIDHYGCESETPVYVPSKCFTPYNAITPNGDGLNDQWEINQLVNYPNYFLTVFNKWGQEVFQTSENYIPWDGGDLPMATYYYVIQLDGRQDDQNIITGSLTIVR